MMMSVNETGHSSELEFNTFFWYWNYICSLPHFADFPTFRDTLNISVITGANSNAYEFQNQYGSSHGPGDERFCVF